MSNEWIVIVLVLLLWVFLFDLEFRFLRKIKGFLNKKPDTPFKKKYETELFNQMSEAIKYNQYKVETFHNNDVWYVRVRVRFTTLEDFDLWYFAELFWGSKSIMVDWKRLNASWIYSQKNLQKKVTLLIQKNQLIEKKQKELEDEQEENLFFQKKLEKLLNNKNNYKLDDDIQYVIDKSKELEKNIKKWISIRKQLEKINIKNKRFLQKK